MKQVVLILATAALILATFLLMPFRAAAKTDIYEGLDPGVMTIGQAIDRADTAAILSALSSGSITRTAYPGSGAEVNRTTAESEIPSLIFNNQQCTDEYGSGGFRLIGLWIPKINPSEVLLIGSGIDTGGTRRSVVFTVQQVGGRRVIVAYGPVVNTAATLAQFAEQGDLRLAEGASPTPASGTGTTPSGAVTPQQPATAPSTGVGSSRPTLYAYTLVALGACLAIAGFSVLVKRSSRP